MKNIHKKESKLSEKKLSKAAGGKHKYHGVDVSPVYDKKAMKGEGGERSSVPAPRPVNL